MNVPTCGLLVCVHGMRVLWGEDVCTIKGPPESQPGANLIRSPPGQSRCHGIIGTPNNWHLRSKYPGILGTSIPNFLLYFWHSLGFSVPSCLRRQKLISKVVCLSRAITCQGCTEYSLSHKPDRSYTMIKNTTQILYLMWGTRY